MEIQITPSKIVVPIFGQVNVGVLIATGVTLLLLVLCLVINWCVKHRFKEIPGFFQSAIEMGVGGMRGYCVAQAGHVGDEIAPYILALALFIFSNCFVEYFGFKPPTGDLSFTFTLGLMTLLLVNIMGIKHRKLSGRLHHYIEPTPVVAPFKLISDLAMPVSLACRLFGNVLAGIIVMELLYTVIPAVVPAVLSIYFTLLHALIQSYVFVTLTLSFVKEATERE